MRMRLNRFLAAAGLGSRRSCEDIIRDGRVAVNGSRVETLGLSIDENDDVRVDGRIVRAQSPLYVVLNKPAGLVTTRNDPAARHTIYDILPPEHRTLAYVGRLDKDSEGLLLLTNDGMLAQRLTHPSHEIDKEYEVVIDRDFDPAHAEKLLAGFHIEGGKARVHAVRRIAPTKLKLVLRQGIKRQIRLMLYALGYEVKKLVRVRIGPLKLGKMNMGESRRLTAHETDALRAAAAAVPVKVVVRKTPRDPRKRKVVPAEARSKISPKKATRATGRATARVRPPRRSNRPTPLS